MAPTKKLQWTHTVPPDTRRMRIDDYCGPVFPILGSKSATKKAIKAGRITLNGSPAVTANFVYEGDVIQVSGTGVRKVKKLDVDLEVVYEDDYLIVVNKPGGIAVNGNRYKTVENALVDHSSAGILPDGLPRPVAAHRIDVPTNGLLVLAKTRTALIEMTGSFERRRITKGYTAVVHGKTEPAGKIDQPIGGKQATTLYETVRIVPSQNYGHLSLVKLKPITGRTHQLRIHMQELGHLIVGDKQYAGQQRTILGKGLLLSASHLSFEHPITGKVLELSTDPPAKFKRIIDREESRAGFS